MTAAAEAAATQQQQQQVKVAAPRLQHLKLGHTQANKPVRSPCPLGPQVHSPVWHHMFVPINRLDHTATHLSPGPYSPFVIGTMQGRTPSPPQTPLAPPVLHHICRPTQLAHLFCTTYAGPHSWPTCPTHMPAHTAGPPVLHHIWRPTQQAHTAGPPVLHHICRAPGPYSPSCDTEVPTLSAAINPSS
jgi:hypothetical protein